MKPETPNQETPKPTTQKLETPNLKTANLKTANLKKSSLLVKTKKMAGRSAAFIWNGLFNTQIRKSVEPGKAELLSALEERHRQTRQFQRREF